VAADHTPQDQYLDADGLRLHYLDWGSDTAPPMLLLHVIIQSRVEETTTWI
jgi:hypothetical protein